MGQLAIERHVGPVDVCDVSDDKEPIWSRPDADKAPFTLRYRDANLELGQEIFLFGKEWVYKRFCGSGGFGYVILVEDKDGNEVIFKCLLKANRIPIVRKSIEERKKYGKCKVIIDYVESDLEESVVAMEYVRGKSAQGRVDMARAKLNADKDKNISIRHFMDSVIVLRDGFDAVLRLENKQSFFLRDAPDAFFHQDITPKNTMLQRGECQPDDFPGCNLPDSVRRVIKYGRCRIIDIDLFTTATEYKKGLPTVQGVPQYMSPEQCMGMMVVGSERSHVGRVAHEMIVGRAPTPGRDLSEVMGRIVRYGIRYSDKQKAAMANLDKNPRLKSVEKAARNMQGILSALEAYSVHERRMYIASSNALMRELFTGGNLITV